jgi:hypothetical protein
MTTDDLTGLRAELRNGALARGFSSDFATKLADVPGDPEKLAEIFTGPLTREQAG